MTGAPAPHGGRVEREAKRSLPVAIATISDTRTEQDDTGGDLIARLLEEHGHSIVLRRIVPDEPELIQQTVAQSQVAGAAVLITTGGTGITRRDSTFEALDALLEKRLPGFGEIFRALSFPEIGPAAMLSRATAGSIGQLLVFALPGSPHAVGLAMERLILPDLPHLAWETVRQ